MVILKKKDSLWAFILVIIITIFVIPSSRGVIISFTTLHPYIGGFIKFFILATMGELLALRIVSGNWSIPKGVIYRALIWAFLGMVIVLIFETFASGVKSALIKGLLPGKNSKLISAFFVSAIMNLTFAPTMMAFHRMTDTYIDLLYENTGKKIGIKEVVNRIDWNSFISFIVLKTIPFFWIPAHTITFLLPPEYRVLAAAALSIALGAILAFAKKKAQVTKKA
jgi:hypothetical protein